MRMSRIQIKNFRNFSSLDVELGEHAVIVGENKVGKSNLLHALRLVLDPTLPDSARYMRLEDFWDGLPRPLTTNDYIEVSVDFVGFDDDAEQLALLAEHLVNPEPLTSRLTYRFQPKPEIEGDPTSESDYEFLIFGGDRPDNFVSGEVRRRLPLDFFDALRDAEADLERWRGSPLRPLLERAAGQLDQARLSEVAEAVQGATEALAAEDPIKQVADDLNERIEEMVGLSQALDVTLGFAAASAERLVRSLRLFIDEGARSVADASLGSANVLYLALRTLERQLLIDEGRRNFSIVAIEEPEAHLHPHLQRLVYADFLQADPPKQESVLLTTHSPHIVSITPLPYIVVLKPSADATATVGYSTASLEFTDLETADLERYLDVTRGEIVFARRVLLVEGIAEEYLLPAFAEAFDIDLDELGVSVCAVGGTNFAPYVRLLGGSGIRTHFAVLTDLDPIADGSNLGIPRARRLLRQITNDEVTLPDDEDDLRDLAATHGIFLNGGTLETEIWRAGGGEPISEALSGLGTSKAMRERAQELPDDPEQADLDQIMADIERVGKGRFAQRLATYVRREHCPDYIRMALEYVAD